MESVSSSSSSMSYRQRRQSILSLALVGLGAIILPAYLLLNPDNGSDIDGIDYHDEDGSEVFGRRALDDYLGGSISSGSDNDNEVGTVTSNVVERDVHVGTMCRCPSNHFAEPGKWSKEGFDTEVIQQPSKATGPVAKRFIHHPPAEGAVPCTCTDGHRGAEPTLDRNMNVIGTGLGSKGDPRCFVHNKELLGRYQWDTMPELGVEQKLPLFVGVLSYESPLSLNATLYDWGQRRFFEKIGATEAFVQMNHMSQLDEQVMRTHQEIRREGKLPSVPLTPMGSPTDNLHPGRAIAKFCRAAENHPNGHPNGENLLLWLEKDWHLYDNNNNPRAKYAKLPQMFDSLNTLMQGGVHYVRLEPVTPEVWDDSKTWNCGAKGFPWRCTTSHRHHWTNLPSVIDCKWFLRYLEPYALLDDPIMYGCRPGMAENEYCDWEFAMGDGRVAWTESNWVVAHMGPPSMKLFKHHEVDK